jgi:hypothetical protein
MPTPSRCPSGEGLVEWLRGLIDAPAPEDELSLVAEVDGKVAGFVGGDDRRTAGHGEMATHQRGRGEAAARQRVRRPSRVLEARPRHKAAACGRTMGPREGGRPCLPRYLREQPRVGSLLREARVLDEVAQLQKTPHLKPERGLGNLEPEPQLRQPQHGKLRHEARSHVSERAQSSVPELFRTGK